MLARFRKNLHLLLGYRLLLCIAWQIELPQAQRTLLSPPIGFQPVSETVLKWRARVRACLRAGGRAGGRQKRSAFLLPFFQPKPNQSVKERGPAPSFLRLTQAETKPRQAKQGAKANGSSPQLPRRRDLRHRCRPLWRWWLAERQLHKLVLQVTDDI